MKIRTLLVAIVAAVASAALASAPSPAFADRCQPEEIIGQPGIIPEEQNPVCIVLDAAVYPLLGCDHITAQACIAGATDPTRLLNCSHTSSPDMFREIRDCMTRRVEGATTDPTSGG